MTTNQKIAGYVDKVFDGTCATVAIVSQLALLVWFLKGVIHAIMEEIR